MNFNQWTLGLAAAGIVSLATVAQAEESAVNSAISGVTLSGAVETSAGISIGRNGELPGRSFDGKATQDGFNFNSARVTLEKAVSEDQFAAGFKTDFVYGADAEAFYGNVIKQAYVALRAPVGNGIDLKLGVFDTPIGFEQFDSGSNLNFSRSYGFYLEPNHHTGLLASYKVVDALSLSAGVANSSSGNGILNAQDQRSTHEAEVTFLAGATITLPEGTGALQGSTINLGVIQGKSASNFAASHDTTSYYGGATINTGITGLTLGTAFDYRHQTLTATSDWAWAAAGYVGYALSEKLKLNARYDLTHGTSGTYFVGTVGDKSNELQSVTLTAAYDLWANVLTRLEGRWDHSMNDETPFGATAKSDNAFTIAADVIYKF